MSGPLALLSRRGLDVQYVLFAHRSSGNIDKLRSVGPCVHDGISWGCSAFHPSLSRVSVFSVFGSPCGLEFGVGPYNVYLLMTELTTKEPTTKTNAASFWMGEGSPSHFWRRKKEKVSGQESTGDSSLSYRGQGLHPAARARGGRRGPPTGCSPLSSPEFVLLALTRLKRQGRAAGSQPSRLPSPLAISLSTSDKKSGVISCVCDFWLVNSCWFSKISLS